MHSRRTALQSRKAAEQQSRKTEQQESSKAAEQQEPENSTAAAQQQRSRAAQQQSGAEQQSKAQQHSTRAAEQHSARAAEQHSSSGAEQQSKAAGQLARAPATPLTPRAPQLFGLEPAAKRAWVLPPSWGAGAMALSPSSLSSSSSLRLLTRQSGGLNPRARRGLELEAVRRRPSGGRDTCNLDKDLDKGDRQGNLQFDSADLHSELHASKGVMHDPDFFDKLDVGAHRIQSGGDLISEYVASKDVMHDPVFPGIVDAQSPRSAKSPLSEMRAIRAAMEDPAIDEDFDFQNLCAAFSCLRVPWSVIKQRRRSHCVVRKSLDADLEDKPCSMDLEPLGRGNKVLAGSVEQVHTSLHPRYPQRKRCRRPLPRAPYHEAGCQQQVRLSGSIHGRM